MPIQRSHLESTQDLASVLGPRQADVMRLLWTRGPATVRQMLTWLTADPPIVYQTIMTICVRLAEKGLVERRLATSSDESARYGQAYVYAPRVSEEEFKRSAVRQQSARSTTRALATDDQAHLEQALAYLGALHSGNDRALTMPCCKASPRCSSAPKSPSARQRHGKPGRSMSNYRYRRSSSGPWRLRRGQRRPSDGWRRCCRR
jgi:predicted transcriptional regulator